jgi:hypothetical protein
MRVKVWLMRVVRMRWMSLQGVHRENDCVVDIGRVGDRGLLR